MKKNKKKTRPIYLLVLGGALLLIAALILLFQNPSDGAASEATSLSDSHEEEIYPEIPRVSIGEAKAALDEGVAVFLDVRDAGSYTASHMPGAINIPTGELSFRLGELDKSEWIIIYCT